MSSLLCTDLLYSLPLSSIVLPKHWWCTLVPCIIHASYEVKDFNHHIIPDETFLWFNFLACNFPVTRIKGLHHTLFQCSAEEGLTYILPSIVEGRKGHNPVYTCTSSWLLKLPWIDQSNATLDASSKASGCWLIDETDQSGPNYSSQQVPWLHLRQTHHLASSRFSASEPTMLAFPWLL